VDEIVWQIIQEKGGKQPSLLVGKKNNQKKQKNLHQRRELRYMNLKKRKKTSLLGPVAKVVLSGGGERTRAIAKRGVSHKCPKNDSRQEIFSTEEKSFGSSPKFSSFGYLKGKEVNDGRDNSTKKSEKKKVHSKDESLSEHTARHRGVLATFVAIEQNMMSCLIKTKRTCLSRAPERYVSRRKHPRKKESKRQSKQED